MIVKIHDNSEMILGFKPLDIHSKDPWQLWQEGFEYPNGIFQTAYAEWQKLVKSPVAPRPTPSNKFGELLTAVGLEQSRNNTERRRKLSNPSECLEKVTKMIEKTGKKYF
jgi:hypothetical protein